MNTAVDCTACPHMRAHHDPIVGCIARDCDCRRGPWHGEGFLIRARRLLTVRRATA